MKIGYFRDAIIREPRHGARWEVDLLQPPYVNDFEAAAQLVATAYAAGGQPATLLNNQTNNSRNVAAANQAPTHNNNNNRKRRHIQSNNNNRSSRTSSSQPPRSTVLTQLTLLSTMPTVLGRTSLMPKSKQ